MDIVKAALQFTGALAMFLFGMEMMAEGLQQSAGDRTKNLLSALTGNPLKGLMTGALVTALIQSSSAATVMVVGFVNAGLMSLKQACYIIMGANIGTTMTAWIVSMGDWAAFLKPEMIAPLMLMIGVIMKMTARTSRIKDASKILIGFGILFTGLAAMSASIKPFTDAPVFKDIFILLGSNPILAVLAGALVTAVIQSSSASMGILQTLASAGTVNWGSAVFIALGQNIGTCITAVLSAVSGDRNAKRAAAIHLEFNVIGSLIFGLCFWVYFLIVPSAALMNVSSTSLALFHTGFNLAAAALLFPFGNQLVKLSRKLVQFTDPKSRNSEDSELLDPRLLGVPSAALSAVSQMIMNTAAECQNLVSQSRECLIRDLNPESLQILAAEIQENCQKIRSYLLDLENSPLSEPEQERLQRSLLSSRDLYQIAARCIQAALIRDEFAGRKLNEAVIENVNTMSSLCIEALGVIAHKDQWDHNERRAFIQRILNRSARTAGMIHQKDNKKDAELADSDIWISTEAYECYESILRRILRLADEDEWKTVPESSSSVSLSTAA